MTARVVIANKTERGSHLSLLSYHIIIINQRINVRCAKEARSCHQNYRNSYRMTEDARKNKHAIAHTTWYHTVLYHTYAYVKEVVPYEYFHHVCVDLHNIHIIDL